MEPASFPSWSYRQIKCQSQSESRRNPWSFFSLIPKESLRPRQCTKARKKTASAALKKYYHWKYGNIYYTKSGKGKPVLLIHDLDPTASSYEWKAVTKKLAENHTVYAIDLLGCGRSEKPNMTYTNYLYVQLMNEFISNVINEKTDVIDALIEVYNSFISPKIDDYNSSVYYENPNYIFECYKAKKML